MEGIGKSRPKARVRFHVILGEILLIITEGSRASVMSHVASYSRPFPTHIQLEAYFLFLQPPSSVSLLAFDLDANAYTLRAESEIRSPNHEL